MKMDVRLLKKVKIRFLKKMKIRAVELSVPIR